MEKPQSMEVIGLPLHAVTYDAAVAYIKALAGQPAPSAVAAANTHLAAAARTSPSFQRRMRRFDLVVPDGMPLVWAMNRKGAGLRDRVYGPYLMREVIRHTPAPYRHALFGGSESCLGRLVPKLKELQPDLNIVHVYSPPFRAWSEDDERAFAQRIRDSSPDFIWVCLGGEKQEAWIHDNLHRHARGVFLAVGDAFSLLAGERPFAPDWMQSAGLTWFYRLVQDPRRLFLRYIKNNTGFLYYWFRDECLRLPRGDPAADTPPDDSIQ